MRALLCALCLLLALLPGACKPDFGERESFVDRAEVLAVRVEPPEAKPGDLVTTTLLVASPEGPIAGAPASWAFCATPKLLTENGSVSAACVGTGVVPIGDAPGGIGALLPGSGCFDFGPETQSAEVRPRDADVTGGYFLPIRARVTAASGREPLTAFGFARLTCNLPNAPADAVTAFRAQYKANRNPVLLPVTARLAGSTAPLALDQVPRGAHVVFRAGWNAEDAETYALFDVTSQTVVTRRESLRVSWFTTAGGFDRDRTGRTGEEAETFTENEWTAPDDARTTQLWVVLRDARGGVSFTTFAVTTR